MERWTTEAGTGGLKLHHSLWNGCLCNSLVPDNIHGVDKLMQSDCLITADEIFSTLKVRVHPTTRHEGPEGE
jgi:hypothetical protein